MTATELPIIDEARAKELLKLAILVRGPSYVTPNGGCAYVVAEPAGESEFLSPGRPAGLALHLHGYTLRQLLDPAESKLNAAHPSVGGHYASILGSHIVDRAAREVFVTAQRMQDNSRPWGEAARAAGVEL